MITEATVISRTRQVSECLTNLLDSKDTNLLPLVS